MAGWRLRAVCAGGCERCVGVYGKSGQSEEKRSGADLGGDEWSRVRSVNVGVKRECGGVRTAVIDSWVSVGFRSVALSISLWEGPGQWRSQDFLKEGS